MLLKAMRVLLQAVRMLAKAIRVLVKAVRVPLKAVRVLVKAGCTSACEGRKSGKTLLILLRLAKF